MKTQFYLMKTHVVWICSSVLISQDNRKGLPLLYLLIKLRNIGGEECECGYVMWKYYLHKMRYFFIRIPAALFLSSFNEDNAARDKKIIAQIRDVQTMDYRSRSLR